MRKHSRPIEELLGDKPYFSARIAATRLQHFGHRLRQHFFYVDVYHPMFDVMASAPRDGSSCALMRRGGAALGSPFSGILSLLSSGGVQCASLHDVCEFALRTGDRAEDVRHRWRGVVRSCLTRLLREGAERVSVRRAGEEGRAWSEADHGWLMERAARIARSVCLDGKA